MIAWILLAVFLLPLAAFLLLGRGRLGGGRAGRMARLGRLSASFSASWLGAKVRRLFAGRERRVRIDDARRQADARRLAETMGEMKGALMKLGQMVSFISDDIPVEYQAALATLQASAPPMDFALLRDVAERELGRPLERAFARFDPKPLASASIGQVHRAQLPDGREVVVKIQYPGVAEAIAADLANVGVLYRFIGLMYPGLDPKPVVAELRARITEELDYVREAANQNLFITRFAGHPFIRVPAVIASHSSARVLTSELAPGKRFADAVQAPVELRQKWGEVLYRFMCESIFTHGMFNGDPHPGNYLFNDDGGVTFLDFGCVKFFPAPMLAGWKKLVIANLSNDAPEFKRRLVEMGFVPENSPLADDLLLRYFRYFYEPFAVDAEFEFTRAYTAKSLGMVFSPTGEFTGLTKQTNMPPDFVFVNRIQWGIYSILAHLGAHANFHRIHCEYLYDNNPPSTPMGVAAAAARAEKPAAAQVGA